MRFKSSQTLMKRVILKFFFLKVILGTLIVLTRKHWFLVWIGLETKTLSILPLISFLQKRRSIEASIKYFVIQALAAAILLNAVIIKVWINGSWLIKSPLKEVRRKIIVIALFLKLRISPFHFWYPEIINGVNLIKRLLITTWQKIAPIIITISLIKNLKIKFVLICALLSIWVGVWGGLKQTQTRKIMAFSSINHIGWIVLISAFNPKISLIMFSIYIIIKTSVFLNLILKKIINLANTKKQKLLKPWKASSFILVILSLGGLPPLTGFLTKILTFKVLVNKNMLLYSVPLILGSLIRLFFYLRIVFNTKMSTFPQNSILIFKIRIKKKVNKNICALLKIVSIAGIFLIPIIFVLFN